MIFNASCDLTTLHRQPSYRRQWNKPRDSGTSVKRTKETAMARLLWVWKLSHVQQRQPTPSTTYQKYSSLKIFIQHYRSHWIVEAKIPV